MPSHRFNWKRPRRKWLNKPDRSLRGQVEKFKRDVNRKFNVLTDLAPHSGYNVISEYAKNYVMWPPRDVRWTSAWNVLKLWYLEGIKIAQDLYFDKFPKHSIRAWNIRKQAVFKKHNTLSPHFPAHSKRQIAQHNMMSKGGNLQHLKDWERKPKPRVSRGPPTRTVYTWKRRGTSNSTSCTGFC